MKRLVLIRHGKSSWKNPGLRDFDRPLNKRGKADAPAMGWRLAQRSLIPDRLLSSPARRAIGTAEIIADAIGFPAGRISRMDRLYGAAVTDLLDILRELDDGDDIVYLVGHNPGLTDLINSTCSDFLDNLPTCGVFCADFEISCWKGTGRYRGKRVFLDVPKQPARISHRGA